MATATRRVLAPPSPSGRGAGGEGGLLPSPSGRGAGGEGFFLDRFFAMDGLRPRLYHTPVTGAVFLRCRSCRPALQFFDSRHVQETHPRGPLDIRISLRRLRVHCRRFLAFPRSRRLPSGESASAFPDGECRTSRRPTDTNERDEKGGPQGFHKFTATHREAPPACMLISDRSPNSIVLTGPLPACRLSIYAACA